MYKVIGADGKEYGPITAEQFRQWLSEGRLNAHTKVRPEGSLEWRTVAEIPELATYLPISATPAPLSAPVSGTVAELVRGPAIFILVLSILNICASLIGIAWIGLQHKLPAFAGMPEQSQELQKQLTIFLSLPANLVGLGIAIVCLFGALQMMKLKSYGLAIATAILLLIPCGSCCCLLNIGAGIWALVVLSKPEVKSAFQ